MADEVTFSSKAISFQDPVWGAGDTIRLLDPAEETLIVRTRDAAANHTLHLFDPDALNRQAPVPTQSVDVPKSAIFFGLGEMPAGEREALLIFTHEGILAYQPATNAFELLIETRSLFRQGTDLRFQRSGFARDLNDDDRYDLLVQGFDGLKVFYQQADGSFSAPRSRPDRAGNAPNGHILHDNVSDTAFTEPLARTPTFRIFPSYIADGTGDGRSDLAFQIGRQLVIFTQKPDGTLSTEPVYAPFPSKCVAIAGRMKCFRRSRIPIRAASGKSLSIASST